MAKKQSKGNPIAPWRFLLFFGILAAGFAIAADRVDWPKALLLSFDGAALIFLGTCLSGFWLDASQMRDTADKGDANRIVLLVLSIVLSAVVFAAIVAELGHRDSLTTLDKVLIAATLAIVWLFANAVYTLHYAHLFYTSDAAGEVCAGLVFPGTTEPLFADFVYFSYTLGVAVQTSDVAVTSRHIRNVVTTHCVAGFFFNLGVLALTINVLGSA